jgi:hypothetical protein
VASYDGAGAGFQLGATLATEPQPQHVEADVTVKKEWDVWRVVERVGVATVLLVLAGNYLLKQDASKQTHIQDEAAKNAAAIKEQTKLDREREKLQAAFIQEQLLKVVESQVTATTQATEATRIATIVNEKSAAAQIKVAESLDEFVDTAGELVERFDRVVDNVQNERAEASQ